MKKLFLSSVLLFPIQSFILSNTSPVFIPEKIQTISFHNNDAVPDVIHYGTQEERHRVWINLTNNQGLFKQILIAYVAGATNGYDHNYDALTMDGNKYADFYSINEDRKLVIQGRALPFDASDIIPLGYRTVITGDHTISIDHADGDLEVQNIYLEDKQTGKIHNLKKGSYTFTSQEGTFTDRFVLRYLADKKLGLNDFTKNPPQLSVASKNQIISLKSHQTTLKKVSVFDITGKLLYHSQQIGSAELQITDLNSGPQVLLVKAVLDNEDIITRKVIY